MEEHQITVLYVDDESDLLNIGKIFLEKIEHIHVDISLSAPKALEVLTSGSYDAIISDYQMPGMDGIQFLQEVRKTFGDIPFILFTGRGREEVVIQAINDGADFYIQKGGEPKSQFAELAHKIRQAVRRKQAEHSVRESEKRFSDIIDFLPDPTFAIDISGKVIAWNKAIEEMTGIRANQIMGKGNNEITAAFYKKQRPLLLDLIDEPDEKILGLYSNIRRADNSLTAETELIDSNGNLVWVLAKVSRLYNETGDVSGAIESIRDITELKKAEQDLRRSVEELALAQEISHIGSWDYNPLTRAVRCSAEALSIFGFPPVSREIEMEELYSCIQEREQVHQALIDLIHEGREYNLEYTVNPADASSHKIVHSLARLEKDELGNITRVTGVIQDITRRKQDEEEIAFKNAILTTEQEVSPDAILIVDTKGIILGFNRNFVTLWGIPDEIITSHVDEPVLQYVSEKTEYPDTFLERVRYLYSHTEEKSFEEILLRDGRVIERFSSPMIGEEGKIFGRVWFFRDITERKRAALELERKNQELALSLEQLAASEEELKSQFNELIEREQIIRVSETRLLMAQQIGHIGCWEYDLVTNKIWGSAEGLAIFGYPAIAGNFPIEDIEACIPERERVHQALIDLLTDGRDYNLEYSINPADGSPSKVIHSVARLEKDPQGNIIRVMGSIQDITEQKLVDEDRERLIADLGASNEELSATYEELLGTEQELKNQYNALASSEENVRQINAYLENLIAIANFPIIVWDPSFHIIRLNRAFELLIGRPAEEVIGKSIKILFPPDQADRIVRLLRTTLEGVRWETTKIDIIRQDGSLRTLLWNSATLYSADGLTPVATIAQGHDITEEIRLEQEKAAALNQIQKNLAYLAILNDEIRNPLSIIITYADGLNDSRIIDLIIEQVLRIDQMVNQLDRRWIESEKVLNAIRKHYNLHVSPTEDTDKGKALDDGSGLFGDTVQLLRKKDEILIEEVQAQLYTILDCIDALVYVADMDTHEILFINKRGKSLFGEVTGQKCYKNLHVGQDRPCPFCTNHLLTDPDGPMGVYQWEFHNTQNNRWYDCRDRLIRWIDGRIVRLEIATDITERKRSEIIPRQPTEFQNIVISSARIWFMVLDMKGVVLFWNTAAQEISGYYMEEVIGNNEIWKLLYPEKEYRRQVRETLKRIITSKNFIENFETTVQSKDGSKKIISWNVKEISNETGEISGYTVIGVDVTERQNAKTALEQQTKFLQVLIDTLPVPIFYKNRDGVYTGCNTAFEHYFGKPRDKVIGKTVYEIWPKNEADVYYNADMSVFNSPHIQQYETSTRYADGAVHQVVFYKAPFYDNTNQVSGLVGTIIDITEQKQSEESLRESNQKLRLLTGLTRHDILNQLSAGQLVLNLALNSSDVTVIHQNISYALEAENKIEKTIGFTREYEDFGTVSGGWYPIRPIIESAKREITPGNSTIENLIPSNLEVYADPIIRKVFTTLLENAIRHGGNMTHLCFSCVEQTDTLIITCEDDGVGIPNEEKELIFDHGYGDHTGIGLFLCREILSITRLSIRETGEEGNGARFEITVPSGKYRFNHSDVHNQN